MREDAKDTSVGGHGRHTSGGAPPVTAAQLCRNMPMSLRRALTSRCGPRCTYRLELLTLAVAAVVARAAALFVNVGAAAAALRAQVAGEHGCRCRRRAGPGIAVGSAGRRG